ncbi:PIN domain protein [Pseudovibrio sp. W64]|uniref:type II toxin-antitoxin system VapC family toxin n=1 Tax=unclassified Pseudovibrio TaxID=2627060 RepID=UPI0007AE74FC|nr:MULTISPECIES: type II toxin-antitoxin system VapC family toxin [unclassified Pseudovibrio]KZK77031.1 PIN domain protein [Pseudovibrio sp. Ad46]KZK83636.1 PIN domain protein [Pseudovibrio sp. W64]
MRRLLLDTHALLWWLAGDPQLGTKAQAIIADPRNDVFVSAASSWEIAIKQNLGKLTAPKGLAGIIEEEGFLGLSISLFHGEQAGYLPEHHKDPFDRMLIAQAQAEGLEIVTSDEKFEAYGVRLVGASS